MKATKHYAPEVRDRAVRMVQEHQGDHGSQWAAICSIAAKIGCTAETLRRWEMLPVHFGPWQTIYWWFRRLMRRFLFRIIHDLCLMLDREIMGREASPSGGVMDSKSVKAASRRGDRI